MPGSTLISNKFLDTVLRLKCPQGDKDILFAIVRLLKGTKEYQGALLVYSIADYLKRNPDQIARRLNHLANRNIIEVIMGPDYLPLRVYTINYHYSEWKKVKRPPVKTKKNSAEPTFWDAMEAEEKRKLKPPQKGSARKPKSAAAAHKHKKPVRKCP